MRTQPSAQPPACRRLPALLGALVVGALPLAPALAASFHNVSMIVTGNPEHTPIILNNTPVHPCGTACRYVNSASTGMSNSYTLAPSPYTVGAWPPVYGTSVPGLASVFEELAVAPPSGSATVQDGGNIGVRQRSKVEYDWQPLLGGVRELSVQTWKTGSGASTVSYAIQLTTAKDLPRRTYLEFTAPVLTRSWQYAGYVGGPSGNQPMTTEPNRVQTRAAVDLYIDGLPVWSSESNLLIPRRFNPPYDQQIFVKWGQPLGDGKVTLFLGTLPAGSTRTIAMVIRTDQRVDATTCHNDSEYGTTYQRCHSQLEALSLPSVNTGSGYFEFKPDFKITTR
ncbi:hypothetical protein HLB44_33115 [Aquincola sp. S2]|uniref:Polysaccharide lyase-like protein n=1 Tax=Pseudaquabacterium terrae TaxID=2732868 RepID=A0ABX2ET76_9BURK|nr:hypothetical protein [Aquabacterium terrae]NRF71838.1 hypothetical protein [Aquabacterium terrae]